jgi:ClpP class serine protease
MRPALDIEQVATGEHWYGTQAQEKGLVDEVGTSDDLLLNLMEGRELIVYALPSVNDCLTALPIARQRARIAFCYAGCNADKNLL